MNHSPRIFCYFCASTLEQKSDFSFYCPSCKYTQYESPKPAVEIMLRRDGKLLIAERGQDPDKGTYDMPGGFIEAGETVEQAALREAEEELGITKGDVENIAYLGSFHAHYAYGKEVYNVMVVVFVADLKSGVNTDALDDVASTRWIDAADIESIAWAREDHRKNARRVLS